MINGPIQELPWEAERLGVGFGRLPSPPDPRNLDYLAEKVLNLDLDLERVLYQLTKQGVANAWVNKLPQTVARPLGGLFGTNRIGRWWEPGPTLNQGTTPRCVAYSEYQLFKSQPLSLPSNQIPPTYVLYRAAQARDPWKTVTHDGSTVHAGSQAAVDLGLAKQYVWLDTVDSKDDPMVRLAAYVLQYGPAWVGTDWHNSMFRPDKNHFVYPDGRSVGGHAYLCIGYNGKTDAFEFINSWGRSFGRGGIFYIRGKDYAPILKNQGEAVGLIR